MKDATGHKLLRIGMSIHHDLDSNAGAPGCTLRLAEAMRGLGHEVTVFSFDDLQGAPATRRYRFPWSLPRLIARRGRFDVLDLSSGDGWVYSALHPRQRRQGGPLVAARSHGLEHVLDQVTRRDALRLGRPLSWKYPLYNGGYRLWECTQSFRRADLCFFLNQGDVQYATERLGVPPASAVLARNGAAPIFLQQAAALATAPPPAGPMRVAFIGSYLPRKGIAVLRDAMVTVLTRCEQASLGFFGTGLGAETVLADYPVQLHGRIEVTERYDNSALPARLAGYHVLAFPSLSEGAALTPVEAMACGLVPVVSSAPGAHEAVTDGVSGLVTPAGDAAALAGGVTRLLEDAAMWRELRAGALRRCGDFAWPGIAEQTVAEYRAAAARSGIAL
jgi:glycosyltransferase involved in cell wall biosynthesis